MIVTVNAFTVAAGYEERAESAIVDALENIQPYTPALRSMFLRPVTEGGDWQLVTEYRNRADLETWRHCHAIRKFHKELPSELIRNVGRGMQIYETKATAMQDAAYA